MNQQIAELIETLEAFAEQKEQEGDRLGARIQRVLVEG